MKTFDLADSLKPASHFIKGITRKVLKISILLMVYLALTVSGGTLAMMVGYIQETPPFDPANLKTPETSFLYDREGEIITRLSGEQNRVVLELNEIPEQIQEAFIAMEDERFFKHIGVDGAAIVRAAWINFRHRSIVQGASTITQQLVKDAFLSPEQNLKRKIQEAYMAIMIEKRYSKQEILELYLNRIYFGNGVYGVEAASQIYYDKSTGDLTLAEAAELAGIINAPNYNNPWASEKHAHRGRNYVLNRMENAGFISFTEANEARKAGLKYAEPSADYSYPYFVDYVLHHELIDILVSLPEYESEKEAYNAIYTQGLRVYTTMDTELQAHVEELLNQDELYPETIYIDMNKLREALRENNNRLPSDYPYAYIDEEIGVAQPQASLVLADPTTGEVMALGGGRHYEKNRNEMLRFRSRRQPGSAIKPVIGYAPAFEEGVLGPGSLIEDAPYVSADGKYEPGNWDDRFWGRMTVRDALVFSRNVPAVKILEKVGPATASHYATRMGITTILDEERGNLSQVLGGFTFGVTLLDMAQAFGVLANEGFKIPLHTVTRIEDRQGNLLWEHRAEPEQILSSQTAYMVNHILEETHRRFIGNRLHIDRPVAAKTGTTDGRRDTYLVSYTPNMVAVFWMGYDIPVMGSIFEGHFYSTAFTKAAFEKGFEGLPKEEFQRPSGLEDITICTRSGLKPSSYCYNAGTVTTDLFTPEMVPQETCRIHVAPIHKEEEKNEEPEESQEDNGEEEEYEEDEEPEDSGDE